MPRTHGLSFQIAAGTHLGLSVSLGGLHAAFHGLFGCSRTSCLPPVVRQSSSHTCWLAWRVNP